MSYLSGFCATETHQKCTCVVTNGNLAASRYAVCRCSCHYENPGVVEQVVSVMGHWPVPHPPNQNRDEIERYVDAVNAIIAASRGDAS